MWGGYLDKAKAFAETIDKQVNDAVGIPSEGSAAGPDGSPTGGGSVDSSSSRPTATTTPTHPTTAAATSASQEDLNDTWNDDFDDDDDNDSGNNSSNAILASVDPADNTPPNHDSTLPCPPFVPEHSLMAEMEPNNEKDDEENGWQEGTNNDNGDEETRLPFLDNDAVQKEPPPVETSIEEEVQFQREEESKQEPQRTHAQSFPLPLAAEEQDPELPSQSQLTASATPPPVVVKDEIPIGSSSPTSSSRSSTCASTKEKNEDEPLVLVEENVVPDVTPFLHPPNAAAVTSTPPTHIRTKGDAGWEDDLYVNSESMCDNDDAKEQQQQPQPVETLKQEPSESDSSPQQLPYATTTQTQLPSTSTTYNGSNFEKLVLEVQEAHPKTQMGTQEDMQHAHHLQLKQMQSQMEELTVKLNQRENQLTSKAEQFTAMQIMHESDKEELKTKIRDTKDEAKRRIGKARERVQDMEQRLVTASSQVEQAGAEEGAIVRALREEGEKLARKQSEMEQAVRSAKGQIRDLNMNLQKEERAKETALQTIEQLDADLKRTKNHLMAARKGENQADKLEAELVEAREATGMKVANNLSLEQQVKELKSETKELEQELEKAKKEGNKEKERSSKILKREHTELLTDFETKLHTSDREANVREDALRHEVMELRKRWQDAVRRADALSMDVQSSTAPLMRQLESTDRQNRVRVTAWAELETKLRSDLEDYVISSDKLSKERNELKANMSRLQRRSKDMEEDLATTEAINEEQSARVHQLEEKLMAFEMERQQRKEERLEGERLANEGVSKVRSEMMQTVVESEERYRSQISGLEKELTEEREKRIGFEREIEKLAVNTDMTFVPNQFGSGGGGGAISNRKEQKEKKLKSTQGQAEILANTLIGLDDSSSDYDEVESSDEEVPASAISGFAAMEQLSQRLKGSTVELKSLRKELVESEKTRESLIHELVETRHAHDKLPFFEQKVKDLTDECRENELEILALRDDISEVKEMYRTQLNILLEEKLSAEAAINKKNGESTQNGIEMTPESESDQ